MTFNIQIIKFYWNYLSNKVLILLFVALLVGVLDGFGLAMFLPLLQSFGTGEEASPEALNKLSFLLEGFTQIGIRLNMMNVLLIMMVFFILKGLLHYQGWKLHIWYKRVFILKMRDNLLSGIGALNYLSFTKLNFGRIQNTLTLEVDRVAQSFSHFVNMVNYFIMMSVYIAMAFSVNFLFATYVTVGGLLTNFFYRFVYKLTRRQSEDFSEQSNIYNSYLVQFTNNFKYLKSTGLVNRYVKQVLDKVDRLEFSRFQIGKLGALLTVVREPMMVVIIGFVLIIYANFHNPDISAVMVSLLFFIEL